VAVVHQTTLTPGKLELLAPWLPGQPWYASGTGAELTRAGGFRLDDPAGQVGIEFIVICASSGGRPRWYQVPLTYRAAPLAGAADAALIGTAEHGVLGQRWVYDGLHDPVLAAQLLALIRGQARAQAQSQSHTPDPTVTARYSGPAAPAAITARSVVTGPHGTDLILDAVLPDAPARLTVRVRRLLEPGSASDGNGGTGVRGTLSATWTMPDNTRAAGLFAVLDG
jgi:Maltokinase N-terminal cap domain